MAGESFLKNIMLKYRITRSEQANLSYFSDIFGCWLTQHLMNVLINIFDY
jgi:hypothetical protein